MVEPEPERIEQVYGYHATRRIDAEAILDHGFRRSANREDWLGDGIYFWQDAPRRAWEWLREPRQRRRFGETTEVAVIEAIITLPLARCVDLFDSGWQHQLRLAYMTLMRGAFERRLDVTEFERAMRQAEEVERPTAHPLDRMIVNELCDDHEVRTAETILAVRSIFPEGRRIYPESAFRERDHVQIAVRDVGLIETMNLMPRSPLAISR